MTATNAATITALLGELKEVDFEAWKEINNISPHFQYRNDCIQGLIQRAIAAKGWPHEQTHYMGNADFWEVKIYSCEKLGVLTEARATTPAAAILAAYIQAVRASR